MDIIIADWFPVGHIRQCCLTHFKEKILYGTKIHTIRKNFTKWNCRIKKFSLRRKIMEVKTVDNNKIVSIKNPGIQKLNFTEYGYCLIDNKLIPLTTVALNDGLTIEELLSWFKNENIKNDYALIHFTGMRY